MKKIILLLLIAVTSVYEISAQQMQDSAVYRASATKLTDLDHTKLEIKLDYEKSWLYGKAWIRVKPHFYSSDSLILDAKGMEIHQVSLFMNNTYKPLRYQYDGFTLRITLDRIYSGGERYTVFIDYTAKPNDVKDKGSAAIRDAKGLYFINPMGTDKNKPTQVWTQGESESNSVWFPTIDKPNQKSTEEIILTVPSKYLSLSNGKLVSSKENGDGTRTDYWEMDLPHAPYLFFFGVGDYAVVKDYYKGKEVNYYVEREYESVARRIFGNTPEMMAFYSKILGVDFPWNKYAQMTARDFVSGAMENTTATLHNSYLQKNVRELTEGNRNEGTVAHELFHQWFGDYVTTESWSNLTLNESFGRFGQIIWATYKYGKDAGDAIAYDQLNQYLHDSSRANLNLVRYYYNNKEDMFDVVSYDKGALILNMLKNLVGDSAFYKALNLYLNTNKFKSAEAADLRLAFESVTGQDLNWYWNQWYYGSGHPKLVIDYKYDDAAGKATTIIRQEQHTGKIFRIPLSIDVYEGEMKTRYKVWIQNPVDSFVFSYKKRPLLINVDGDKIILCEKEDHKSLDNFIFQFQHAGLFRDRMETIVYCAQNKANPDAQKMISKALSDPSAEIKLKALDILGYKGDSSLNYLQPKLAELAIKDQNKIVRGLAIYFLGSFRNEKYKSIFLTAMEDSSYFVAGRGLEAFALLDSVKALSFARKMANQEPMGRLSRVIQTVLDQYGDSTDALATYENFDKLDMGHKYGCYEGYIKYLSKLQNDIRVKLAIDQIISYRVIVLQYDDETGKNITRMLKELQDQKISSGLREQADYIKTKL